MDQPISDVYWYAVTTRSRQEKMSAATLEGLGVSHFLPLLTEIRQWSDRKQSVRVPLFPSYLFVRMNLLSDARLKVLKVPGIVGFVGNHLGPLPIPDAEIENIHTVFAQGLPCAPHPFFKEGDRVRVVRGVLAGVEGTLLRTRAGAQLVISIDMIQRSLSVSISARDVELVVAEAEPVKGVQVSHVLAAGQNLVNPVRSYV